MGTEVHLGIKVNTKTARSDIIFTDDINNKGVIIEFKFNSCDE